MLTLRRPPRLGQTYGCEDPFLRQESIFMSSSYPHRVRFCQARSSSCQHHPRPAYVFRRCFLFALHLLWRSGLLYDPHPDLSVARAYPDWYAMAPGGSLGWGIQPHGWSSVASYGQCQGAIGKADRSSQNDFFFDFPQDELFDGTPEQCAYVCANARFDSDQGCTVFSMPRKEDGQGIYSGLFGDSSQLTSPDQAKKFCCLLYTGSVRLRAESHGSTAYYFWKYDIIAFAAHLGFRQPLYRIPGDKTSHAVFDRVANPLLTVDRRRTGVLGQGAIGPCGSYGGTDGYSANDVLHRGWPDANVKEAFDGQPQTCANHCAEAAGCTHFALQTGGCDSHPTVYADAISPNHPDRAPTSWTPDYSLASAETACGLLFLNAQLHLSALAKEEPDRCGYKKWVYFQMRLEEGRNRPGIAVPLNQGKTFGFLPTSSHGATKSPKCAAHQELPAPSSTCWQDSGSTLQQQVEVDKRDVTYAAGDFDFAASSGATNVNEVATYVPGDPRTVLEAGNKIMKASPVGSDGGFWYAKFKDGNAKYVSSFTLWPRGGCFSTDPTVGDANGCSADSITSVNESLDGACVRLQLEGEAEPSGAAPVSRCDITVPAKGSDRSARTIPVNAKIVGFKIVAAAAHGKLQFAGITDINAATPSSEDVLPDSGVWFTTMWPVTVVRLRDLVEQGGATAEAYFPRAEVDVLHRFLNVQDRDWYIPQLKNPVNYQWFYFTDNYGDRLGLAGGATSGSNIKNRKRSYNLLDNCYHLGLPETKQDEWYSHHTDENKIQITLHATPENQGLVKVFALNEMPLTSVPPWMDEPHWFRGPEGALQAYRSDSSGSFRGRDSAPTLYPNREHNGVRYGSYFTGMRQALMEPGQKLNVRRMVSAKPDGDGNTGVPPDGHLQTVFVCTNYPQEEHKNNFFQDLLIREQVHADTLEVRSSLWYPTFDAANAATIGYDRYAKFALFPMTWRKKYQATDYFDTYGGPGVTRAANKLFYGILNWRADGESPQPLASLGGPYGLEEDSTAFLQLNWNKHVHDVPGDQVAIQWTNGPLPVRVYLTLSKGKEFSKHTGFRENEDGWGGGGWTREEVPGTKLKWRGPVSVWNSADTEDGPIRVETVYSKVFAPGAVIKLHGNAPPSYSRTVDPYFYFDFSGILVTLQVLGPFFTRGVHYPYTVQAEKHFSGNLGITANLGDFESFPLHDDVHRNHSRPLSLDFLEELEISLNWGSAKNNRKRPLMLVQLMRLRKYPTTMPEQHGMYESLTDKIAEDYVEFYPARHRAPYNKKTLHVGTHSVVRKAKKGDFFYFYLLLSKCGIERMTVNMMDAVPKGTVLPPTSVKEFGTGTLPKAYPFHYKCPEGTDQLTLDGSWGGSSPTGERIGGSHFIDPDQQDATGYYDQLNVDSCAQRCKGEYGAYCKSFGYFPIGWPNTDGTTTTQAVCFLWPNLTPDQTRVGGNSVHCGRREWGSVVQAVNAVSTSNPLHWLANAHVDPFQSYVQANGNNADSPGTGALVFKVRVSAGVTRLYLAGTFGNTGGSLMMVYVQPASPIATYIHGFGARAPTEADALTTWISPRFDRTDGLIAANFTEERTINVKLLALQNDNCQGLQVGRLRLIATGGEAVFLFE